MSASEAIGVSTVILALLMAFLQWLSRQALRTWEEQARQADLAQTESLTRLSDAIERFKKATPSSREEVINASQGG